MTKKLRLTVDIDVEFDESECKTKPWEVQSILQDVTEFASAQLSNSVEGFKLHQATVETVTVSRSK